MNKRNTLQRSLVLASVQALANHPTADEVYENIHHSYPNISKGTVYRNLNSLAEDRCIKKISMSNAADRFDHKTAAHYHIQCVSCGQFSDLTHPYLTRLDGEVAQESGYAMESHDIVFRGICPHCQHSKAVMPNDKSIGKRRGNK